MVIIHYYYHYFFKTMIFLFFLSFIVDFVYFPLHVRLSYLHEEDADDESRSLAVANFTIMQRIGFHDVEETFLAQAIFLFEEVVFRVRASYVATDDLSFFKEGEDVLYYNHHSNPSDPSLNLEKTRDLRKNEKCVNLFTGGCGFDIFGVLRFGRRVMGTAQKWPDDTSEMMRDPFADKIFDVGISLLVRIGPIGHQTAP